VEEEVAAFHAPWRSYAAPSGFCLSITYLCRWQRLFTLYYVLLPLAAAE
jgi:hypothetical protein